MSSIYNHLYRTTTSPLEISESHILPVVHFQKQKMHSRAVFVLCTIAIFLFVVSSSVADAEERFHPRAKKLSNAAWLAAPHFQALSKRGRFVFRDAPNDHFYDSINDDTENFDLHPDKRNWRL